MAFNPLQGSIVKSLSQSLNPTKGHHVLGSMTRENVCVADNTPRVVKLEDCTVLHLVVGPEPLKPHKGLYLVIHKTFGFLVAVNEGLLGAQALISKFGVELGRKLIGEVLGELMITPEAHASLIKDLGHRVVRICT